jgi:hypothetical protein
MENSAYKEIIKDLLNDQKNLINFIHKCLEELFTEYSERQLAIEVFNDKLKKGENLTVFGIQYKVRKEYYDLNISDKLKFDIKNLLKKLPLDTSSISENAVVQSGIKVTFTRVEQQNK